MQPSKRSGIMLGVTELGRSRADTVRRRHRPARFVLLASTLAALAVVAAAVVVRGQTTASTIHTYTFRVGPYRLGGYQVRYSPDRDPVPAPPIDGFVTRMYARVVDASGHSVPVTRIMLHHVIFTDRGTRSAPRHDGTCPTTPERFYGTGEESEALRLPPGYGYRISKNDRWEIAWMLMNHRLQPDADYIQYTVTVDTSKHMTPVTPYWLSVVPCSGDPIFNVPGGGPPGSTTVFTHAWHVPIDGRIIASGSHVHGGDKAQILAQPYCNNRALIDSRPLYGKPSDIVYHVLPVLHEPGPISTDWFESPTGIPIHRGERLQLLSEYDDQYIHTRAMGLLHVYVAPPIGASNSAAACAPLPNDIHYLRRGVPGERTPPHVTVPLMGFDSQGHARVISRPPGAFTLLPSGAAVKIKNFSFSTPDVSLQVGSTLHWSFGDSTPHNVTVADGPRGFASATQSAGGRFSYTFKVPGTYRLFCSLHPWMTEVVVVKGGK